MRYLLFIPVLLLAAGCTPKKTVATAGGTDATTITAAKQVLQKMEANRFSANWVDARANLKLESPQMNVGGTAYIRLEKDKRIWMSVKKFGFEAARAFITPDSFFVINRLTNEYTAEPLSYVEEKYQLPARFDLLQEIILGNPVFLDRNLTLKNSEEGLHLSGNGNRWLSDYYLDGETFRLNSMKLKERAVNRTLNIFMDDYQPTELEQNFAYRRSVEIDSPQTGLAKIELDFSKLTFNEAVEMPFAVPGKFSRGK